MGDDEFFSTSTSSTAPHNPLTPDELILFSRILLNIAFALYWRDDQTNVQEGGVPGVNLKWEAARERVTKCLLAIHARECVYVSSLAEEAIKNLVHAVPGGRSRLQGTGLSVRKSTCNLSSKPPCLFFPVILQP
jgi:hypothetical protein